MKILKKLGLIAVLALTTFSLGKAGNGPENNKGLGDRMIKDEMIEVVSSSEMVATQPVPSVSTPVAAPVKAHPEAAAFSKKEVKAAAKEARKEQKTSRRDGQNQRKPMTDQVVLVLLAIFIPPVAVYLVENTSTNFWIDLILAVLGLGGWYFFFYSGLFWLAAIILALVVVLR